MLGLRSLQGFRRSPLILAAKENHLRIARLLLARGARTNLADIVSDGSSSQHLGGIWSRGTYFTRCDLHK